MSFGFGVGDFLAVADASRKIWNQYEKSPDFIRYARKELRNISGFIQEEEAGRMKHITDPIESTRVQRLFDTCKDCVEDSSIALDKYKEIEVKSKGLRAMLKRVFLRLKYDEQDMVRARERIQNALKRLESGIRTLDSQLLQHINSVVERTAVDVGDTKAGVERTEQGVERTEKGIELTKAGVDQLHDHEAVKDRNDERKDIIKWICPSEIDYTDQQNEHTSKREQGIGEWFVDTQEFKSWLQRDRATLLCSGMPGAGKTMTTSFVVDTVRERYANDDQIGFAYIYCQHLRHAEQTPEYLMTSILRQLLEKHDTIANKVRAAYNSKTQGKGKLVPSETYNLLNVVLGLFAKTIIIVDALDELRSASRVGLITKLIFIQQKFNVNIYATSRIIEEIAYKAPNATHVEIRARKEDLRRMIDSILELGFLLSDDPDLRRQVLDEIMQATNGIYLLAERYAQYMASAREMTRLSAILEGLKSGSDPYTDMYGMEMKRLRDDHEIEHSELGLIAICWLFLAKRPLRAGELVHALAIDGNVSSLVEKNVPLMSSVLKACAGLVVVNEAHNTVGLFHKTFHEYLVENRSAWFPHGNDIIGTTCVRYLSLDAFADGPCPKVDPASSCSMNTSKGYAISYEERLMRYSLYEYASEHWHDHIRGSDLETADIITNFLADSYKVSASCQRSGHQIPRTTGVHVATQLLLERSLERHLQSRGADPNAKDHTERRPLTYAAELDGVGVINHLITAGADIDSEDSISHWRAPTARTALSCAASKGNLSACEVLLKEGANVNYRDFYNRSALSFAAEHGSVAVARFLLQNGARIDPQDLSWAGATESTEVVSLFLDHGADIDLSEGLSTFILIQAAEISSVPLISFLVKHGARVNAINSTGETPLCRAVLKKHIESVRFLIDAGADVNLRLWVPHPLIQATSNGSKEIAHLLILAGSEVNVQDRTGLTPLAYAAREGWTDVVKLLLDKGADPNGTNDGSESVLTFAAGSGSVETVEMLLQHGTDINRFHGLVPYCIPLYMALGAESIWSISGRPIDERMLEFLLSKGANPNQVMDWEPEWEKTLDPPLLHALNCLPKDDDLSGRLVRLLLEHGARTDILSMEGLSVLECAKHHSKEVQDLLRRYGAK